MIEETLLQSFDPVIPDQPVCMILGSMPGVASLDANQYYAHPRNGFWKILQSVFGGEIDTYHQRLQILSLNRIALWDSLKYCKRPGSLDSSIATDSTQCNDFESLLQQHTSIELILFNGKAAEKWFRKLALPAIKQPEKYTFASLPSTSPAMAMLSLEEKTRLWRDALSQIA